MNNEIDLLEELEREERNERLEANGGGAGAALGVLLTFVIGCGLVFASYKLGQRKTVDEPPLIAANNTPIKIAPEDEGGAVIPNTGNLANAMIDGKRPVAGDYALRDGVIIETDLPDRTFEPVIETEQIREIRREVTQLTGLKTKNSIEGEPSLNIDGVPDRSDELLITADAEVAPVDAQTPETIYIEDTAAPQGLAPRGDNWAATSVETAVSRTVLNGSVSANAHAAEAATTAVANASAVNTAQQTAAVKKEQPADRQITLRVPSLKPRDFGAARLGRPSANTGLELAAVAPALAPDIRPERPQIRRRAEPAIARIRTPALAEGPRNSLNQPAAQLPSAGLQRVRIPTQPVGDAQVQLGAFPTAEEVRGRWQNIRSRHPDLLGRLGLQVQPVQTADGRRLFRMRVGPLRDTSRAAQLCQALNGRGVDCFVPQRR